ncbi:MAG: FAD-dependent oxidoreductase [SAR86 cluster bacterium]|uniref:FAD-dependent oxidoreductase n=1 Tax=SAR86 cluster bacterium TaxID=2030880 RepID=A0A2A4X8G3_9GAMM|nr:FAD-binding oxidoreductase [Sneathiella sp.]PCI78794.1 MAG: FAD-dependent oxidoreductase [SAR86 cluster bacterium]
MNKKSESLNISYFPYWWEAAEPKPAIHDLPSGTQDVVIVGAGYTGLSAALTLAKSGLSVVVLDTQLPGFGASSRNGGMISNLLKPGLSGLMAKYGIERGEAIYRESLNSVDFVKKLVGDEEIECDLNLKGRLYPAVLEKHLDAMKKETALKQKHLGIEDEIIGKGQCQEDIASDLYVGGFRQFDTGGLHPAKFVEGLASAVEKNGGLILAPCTAKAIKKKSGTYLIDTSLGTINCDKVVIATNGYSGGVYPSLEKKVIPIGSTMIATEKLSKEMVSSLFPTGRMIADSRKMLSYFRPSPDGTRVLLGGRPTVLPSTPDVQARALQKRLADIFPQLRDVAVSHVWTGNVAYSFDALPAIGHDEGIYFALGYCGSGVAMSGYLGHKVALKILKSSEGDTAFDGLPFESKAYYQGQPWFLPIAMAGYKLRDTFGF